MAKKTLKDLKDELALRSAEADKLLEAGDAEQRNLNSDEHAAFETKSAEIRSLQTQIAQLEVQESFQIGRAAAGGAGMGNRDSSKQDRKDMARFNLNRALLLDAEQRSLDGIELEVSQEGEKRALQDGISIPGPRKGIIVLDEVYESRALGQGVTIQNTAPGDLGGLFVKKELQSIQQLIQAKTFLSEWGVEIMSGLKGDLVFPVQETTIDIQELTEIEEMEDDEITFSSFEMKPSRRGATVPISYQILDQSSIDMQGFVLNEISSQLAQKLNREVLAHLLTAITSANDNLLALGTDGATATWEDIVKLETMIDSIDHLQGSPKYLTNAKVKGKLKVTQKFTGTNGIPVWGDSNDLNGYSAVTTNMVPSTLTKGTSNNGSAIIFGDPKGLAVGRWGGTRFITNPYTKAKKGQIEVTANAFWGVKVKRAKSFAGIKDALTF
ncbi:phage major capsid protein [Dyadobacter sp. CY312]|uniref:phage major capsid protein n=1 Tax=Dyadobacter sp. CY312 TaxID=2907303 RepID=UPI001F30FBF9|nr:phage major capsid protein [Dyadobacter sp. CY312]MCE7038986.1 phage major capsid protein [Dyadobacter sp. CY312]